MNKDIPFLFDEAAPIFVVLCLYYNKDNKREYISYDAIIRSENDCYKIIIELSNYNISKEAINILSNTIKKKDYKITNALVSGINVKVNIKNDIKFTHFYTEGNQKYCSMTFKELDYVYVKNGKGIIYRLSSIATEAISSYLNIPITKDDIVIGVESVPQYCKIKNKHFKLYKGRERVYLQTEEEIDMLFELLSFYFCTPIEYDMKCKYDEKNCLINITTPNYKIQATNKNKILDYLFSEEKSLSHLFDFLDIIDSNIVLTSEQSQLIKNCISNYIRAEYLDNTTKLLIYTTILSKIAGAEKNKDTYSTIKHFFKSFHIDIDIINCNINKRNIKNEKNKNIENFIELRNFFIHHFGSKEAVDFLDNHSLLFLIKSAITIILLKLIGVKEIVYDKRFHSLSIFNNNIEECDYFSKLALRLQNT